MEVKDNQKRAADQIKILTASKVAPTDPDSDASATILRKKKSINGVLPACKQQGDKTPSIKILIFTA